MTEADADRIESALGVKLPAEYRRLLTNFPIAFERGGSSPVWDNADRIIERNVELRSARRSLGVEYQAVPTHYLFIGDDGGGWQHLLDLRTDPPLVVVMEFEDIGTIDPAMDADGKPLALREWFQEYLTGLENDGVDLNAAEDVRGKLNWKEGLGCLVFCVVAAVVIALLVFGFRIVSGAVR